MTRDEILAIDDNRKIDALVWMALHNQEPNIVMCRFDGVDWLPHAGYPIGHISPPHYSTYMGAAWQVVEKFENRCMLNNVHGIWECYFPNAIGKAETAPLAICRAALLAVTDL